MDVISGTILLLERFVKSELRSFYIDGEIEQFRDKVAFDAPSRKYFMILEVRVFSNLSALCW